MTDSLPLEPNPVSASQSGRARRARGIIALLALVDIPERRPKWDPLSVTAEAGCQRGLPDSQYFMVESASCLRATNDGGLPFSNRVLLKPRECFQRALPAALSFFFGGGFTVW